MQRPRGRLRPRDRGKRKARFAGIRASTSYDLRLRKNWIVARTPAPKSIIEIDAGSGTGTKAIASNPLMLGPISVTSPVAILIVTRSVDRELACRFTFTP